MLRIVTQNIWGKNNEWQTRADAIGQNMQDLDVDVLCIQESSPDHFDYLKDNSFKHFDYAFYAPSDDGTKTPGQQGLAMFSRLPSLLNGQADLGREDHPNIDPWMRIIHYIQIERENGSKVTIFNTHLFLNSAQKRAGINGCARAMAQPELADTTRILAGDFNIVLDRPGDALIALTEHNFVDIWGAKHADEVGLTWPLYLSRPPERRIDGFFIRQDDLASVQEIKLINDTPINDGQLLLSDHIAVMISIDV